MSAVLTTELDVHHALRRRGVAYEVGSGYVVLRCTRGSSIISFFELKKEPMEGFAQVDLATSCSSRP